MPRSGEKNQLRLIKRQVLEEGLLLASRLKKGQISPLQFARKFSKIKESIIFENLTGLFTNHFFGVELKREMAVARRYGIPLCLMVVDMDKLKEINDKYGHEAGNEAIVFLSRVIVTNIREEDIPCRWGGDEFVVILPYTDVKEAQMVAERIMKLIKANRLEIGKNKVKIGTSIGIAKHEMLDTPASLFKKADRAVYEAKRTGRGKINTFSEALIKR